MSLARFLVAPEALVLYAMCGATVILGAPWWAALAAIAVIAVLVALLWWLP